MKLRVALFLLITALGGCGALPLPSAPTRWLDPTVRFRSSSELSAHAPLGLRSQSHLTQKVVMRLDDAVAVYEPDCLWMVMPEEVLRRAFSWARVPLRGARATYQVELSVFELQRLATGPSARVACTVATKGSDAEPSDGIEVVMPAADESVSALTDAMGKAVQELVARILARTRRR